MKQKMKTAYSQQASVEAAVREVRQQMEGFEPTAVMFFSSSQYAPEEVARSIQAAFPGAQTFGCTTAGEIVTGRMLKGSLVAMAFGPQVFPEVRIELVHDLASGPNLDGAFKAFESHFGVSMRELDFSQYLGFVLIDGLSGAEEHLLDTIGNMTDVSFIGGSAGDDLQFKSTHVFANGKAYRNAAILALTKPAVPFHFIKTQSFKPLSQSLVATKVIEASREVLEFNGQPAAHAYAAAIQKPVEQAAELFMRHPVGLMVGDEPFVRSPQQIKGDGIVFYCNIKEGMELSLLESTDIVGDTRESLEALQRSVGPFSGLINFNCILRTLELDASGQADAYGRVFAQVPTVGFSTYGEAFIGHINQTSTMVAFS